MCQSEKTREKLGEGGITLELGHSSGVLEHQGRETAKPKDHGKNYYLLFKKEALAMSTTWIFKSRGHHNGVSD